jgi:predicted short-subunit dehydrogenase-like oxidoreductase (DUF2520 family)
MRVVLLGAGRMATALANSLPGVTPLSARGTPSRPPGRARCVWVLCVPDAALPAVCAAWSAVMRAGDVALHLAGMLGPEVLAAARGAGAEVGSMHPLAAVAPRTGARHLRGAAFCVEGDPGAVRAARSLCREMRATLLEARAVDRAGYHGGAALMATGAVALAQGAARMFSEAITPTPAEADVREAVASLLESVAANVRAVGVDAALASPLMRDDAETVARHLGAMASVPAADAMYRAAVGVVVETLSRRGGVRAETLARAREILATRGAKVSPG